MMYSTGKKHHIREINKSSIMQVIQENGAVSRAEISRILGLTPATISKNISALIAEGLVKESSIGSSNGGRKPILLEIDESCVFFIGVDIHKDGVEAAAVTLTGNIVAREVKAFGNAQGDFKKVVIECISTVRKRMGGKRFHAIGVGMHGIVDTNRDLSIFAPAMGSHNLKLKSYIEKSQNIPVFIDNDSNAMALGESQFGQASGIRDFVFLNVSRGIGAGIVLNGELYRGSRFAAGEIGHVRVVENGSRCVCGNYGCLDTVATEYSVIKDITNAIQTGVPSVLKEMTRGNLHAITSEMVFNAAKMGDRCTLDALEKMGRYIGVALSYVMNILNPEMIIIGGSMSLVGDYFMQVLTNTTQALSLKESMPGVKIILSSLKENVGVLGSAALGIQKLFMNK